MVASSVLWAAQLHQPVQLRPLPILTLVAPLFMVPKRPCTLVCALRCTRMVQERPCTRTALVLLCTRMVRVRPRLGTVLRLHRDQNTKIFWILTNLHHSWHRIRHPTSIRKRLKVRTLPPRLACTVAIQAILRTVQPHRHRAMVFMPPRQEALPT